ncbi:DUF1622 domain-containing protein [Nodosilinea sp. P-1105]|uniref:DUF1622 domain-containing protein n=1 Tax=Nodosilinea sp. P-1105 TaxID=2546229 RepID=UPI00146BE9D1|nr:DUF1622 domain-containing protein [Nodosilinea sp. P-1105]NMF85606.1 DUF1622 domain-containing protein [Nodosilinea sp. P-1105]
MPWLDAIETFSFTLAKIGETLLEALGVICIVVGLIVTVRLTVKILKHRHRVMLPFIQIRLKFGLWLALALEFQLGADILSTAIAPSNEALIRLSVIAVIRTFLNYFLNKEVEAQMELRERAIAHNYAPLFMLDSPIDFMEIPQDIPKPPNPRP